MYFWKIEKLKQDIKSNKLSEKDRFIYVLVSIAFGVLGSELIKLLPPATNNIWDTIDLIANIIIPVIGTIYAFKANGSDSGTDFLGRFVSIGFVVAIRFLVILIPMIIVLFIYYLYMPPEDEQITTPIDIIPFQVWYALYYWRLCFHIADVKNN